MGGVVPENAGAALKSLARCPTLLRFLPCICILRNKIPLINELSGRPNHDWPANRTDTHIVKWKMKCHGFTAPCRMGCAGCCWPTSIPLPFISISPQIQARQASRSIFTTPKAFGQQKINLQTHDGNLQSIASHCFCALLIQQFNIQEKGWIRKHTAIPK